MYKTKEITYNVLVALSAFMLCRLLFITFNSDLLIGSSFIDSLLAIIHGIRFDLSYLGYALSLYGTISFFPFSSSKTDVLLKYIFVIAIGISLFPNIIDLKYIVFSGRRLTADVLAINNDIGNQTFQLFINYWYILLIEVILVYLLIRFYQPLQHKNVNLKKGIFRFILYALILVLVIRGGFQKRPLSSFHALNKHSENLSTIALNSSFSFIHSFKYKKLVKYQFYANDQIALEIIKKYQPQILSQPKPKENIVILLLESFATEYTGLEDSISYAPFLDSLSQHGLYFKNFYANGRRSFDALPPLLCGLPNLIDETFIYSSYHGNAVHGMPKILAENGYTTSFYHGGKNGSFRFDVMGKKAGIQNYYGMNEYPNQDDFDGAWGIYDHLYLQHVANQLNAAQQPFFNLIFTLSSHNPFPIPKEYQNRFPKGKLDIHESVGYSDNALRLFFNAIKTEEWYNNTLFILTADHSQKSIDKKYKSYTGWYDIPLVLFHPSKKLKSNNLNGFFQHQDIPKTIVNYLGLQHENLLLSNSVLEGHTNNYNLIYENKTYRLFNDQYTVKFADSKFSYYNFEDSYEKQPINRNDKITELEDLLKAIIQVYNNKMIENKLESL